jgi:hypothetical protein
LVVLVQHQHRRIDRRRTVHLYPLTKQRSNP